MAEAGAKTNWYAAATVIVNSSVPPLLLFRRYNRNRNRYNVQPQQIQTRIEFNHTVLNLRNQEEVMKFFILLNGFRIAAEHSE